MGKAKIVSAVFELMVSLKLNGSEKNQAIQLLSGLNHTQIQKEILLNTGNPKVSYDFRVPGVIKQFYKS